MILFAALSYHSVRWNHAFHAGQSRYFWWSSVRLDSDPLNRHPKAPITFKDGNESYWDPAMIWVSPGWFEIALVLSGLPAFLSSMALTHGLGRLGISEVVTFMISMPLCLVAWFYWVGLFFDRWAYKRSVKTHVIYQ